MGLKKALLILTSAFALQTVSFAVTITKPPNVGGHWHWLRPNPETGTYVYADSFVAPISGDVTSLGTWVGAQVVDPTTTLLFQVWGSVGNNAARGPDAANVLASSSPVEGISGPLTFYSAAALPGVGLLAGQTYWFVASAVGSTGSGSYFVGQHRQNSIYADNGTFWFSNDAAGVNFDGQSRTPEMAFSVTVNGVPDAGGSASLLCIAFFAICELRFLTRNRKLLAGEG